MVIAVISVMAVIAVQAVAELQQAEARAAALVDSGAAVRHEASMFDSVAGPRPSLLHSCVCVCGCVGGGELSPCWAALVRERPLLAGS